MTLGSQPRADPAEAPLELHLRTLQALGIGRRAYRVAWMPGARADADGDFRDGVIIVYVGSLTDALQVVTAQAVKQSVLEAAQPYKTLTNAILRSADRALQAHADALAEGISRQLQPGGKR